MTKRAKDKHLLVDTNAPTFLKVEETISREGKTILNRTSRDWIPPHRLKTILMEIRAVDVYITDIITFEISNL